MWNNCVEQLGGIFFYFWGKLGWKAILKKKLCVIVVWKNSVESCVESCVKKLGWKIIW